MSRKRGFVSWLSGYCRRSQRQLANLAPKYNIPRAENDYNFDWGANLNATATLIRDLTRFRKGNRKGRRRSRSRMTLLDQFACAVHRIAWLAQIDKIATLQERDPVRKTNTAP
jgi:hypothetical protein